MMIKCMVCGAADPGAVPGGSTKTRPSGRALTGPNQDRRANGCHVFVRAGYPVSRPKTTSANDNEALAIAA